MNKKKVGISIGIVLLVVAVVGIVFYFLPKEEKEIIYKVTFDNDGVTEVIDVKENQLVTQPVTPTKEGYTFDGWYYNGTKFDFTTEITKNITLEARWLETSAKKWKVTFDVVGGQQIEPLNVVDGKKIDKIPTPTKDGYKFVGWYHNNNKFDSTQKITKDITLVAKWEKIATEETDTPKVSKYTVTFDSNGGSSVPKQNIEQNKTASKPSNPTRDGYVFLGWYNGETEFDFKTKITKNIKLIAKWEKIETPIEPEKPEEPAKYTVKFDTAGGNAIPNQTVEEGKIASKPENPTRDGYTFIAWYHNDTQYNFSATVTSDITLTAKWQKNAPVYTHKWVSIEGSVGGEAYLYIMKDGTIFSGKADITSQSGKVATVTVPTSGLKLVEDQITKVSNIREN